MSAQVGATNLQFTGKAVDVQFHQTIRQDVTPASIEQLLW